MEIDVMDYGAYGDGIHDDTIAIQRAIDYCSITDSGIVILRSGRIYLTGGLRIKSYVRICIEKDAVLKGNGKEADCIVRPGYLPTVHLKISRYLEVIVELLFKYAMKVVLKISYLRISKSLQNDIRRTGGAAASRFILLHFQENMVLTPEQLRISNFRTFYV